MQFLHKPCEEQVFLLNPVELHWTKNWQKNTDFSRTKSSYLVTYTFHFV